jgi:hypothetical protein
MPISHQSMIVCDWNAWVGRYIEKGEEDGRDECHVMGVVVLLFCEVEETDRLDEGEDLVGGYEVRESWLDVEVFREECSCSYCILRLC